MENNLDFSINIENFREIPFQKYDKDFTFIVNGKHYQVPRILADFLSPIIRNFHFTDESMHIFSINTNETPDNNDNSIDYFTEFINLVSKQKVTLDKAQQKKYSEYFYALGNINEYLSIQNNTDEIELNNVISQLLLLSRIPTPQKAKQQLISFVSNHFFEIELEEMKKIKIEILEEILSNDELKIKDEDSLLNFILSLYEKDSNYSILFDYIIFSNVSKEGLLKFINAFDIDFIDSNIWRSICQRLISSAPGKNIESNRYKYTNIKKEFKYSMNDPFKGIMRYLTDKSGGNIHDNGTIEITTNSICDDNKLHHPKNLVDYNNNKNFYLSKDDGDAFVCFDFKNKLVHLKSYAIKSSDGPKNNYFHLKNWNIEASENGDKWDVIDSHKNDSCLNGPNIIYNFNISEEESKFYRFFRLHQTGQCWEFTGNHNRMRFIFIEFYGEMIDNSKS